MLFIFYMIYIIYIIFKIKWFLPSHDINCSVAGTLATWFPWVAIFGPRTEAHVAGVCWDSGWWGLCLDLQFQEGVAPNLHFVLGPFGVHWTGLCGSFRTLIVAAAGDAHYAYVGVPRFFFLMFTLQLEGHTDIQYIHGCFGVFWRLGKRSMQSSHHHCWDLLGVQVRLTKSVFWHVFGVLISFTFTISASWFSQLYFRSFNILTHCVTIFKPFKQTILNHWNPETKNVETCWNMLKTPWGLALWSIRCRWFSARKVFPRRSAPRPRGWSSFGAPCGPWPLRCSSRPCPGLRRSLDGEFGSLLGEPLEPGKNHGRTMEELCFGWILREFDGYFGVDTVENSGYFPLNLEVDSGRQEITRDCPGWGERFHCNRWCGLCRGCFGHRTFEGNSGWLSCRFGQSNETPRAFYV